MFVATRTAIPVMRALTSPLLRLGSQPDIILYRCRSGGGGGGEGERETKATGLTWRCSTGEMQEGKPESGALSSCGEETAPIIKTIHMVKVLF